MKFRWMDRTFGQFISKANQSHTIYLLVWNNRTVIKCKKNTYLSPSESAQQSSFTVKKKNKQ